MHCKACVRSVSGVSISESSTIDFDTDFDASQNISQTGQFRRSLKLAIHALRPSTNMYALRIVCPKR